MKGLRTATGQRQKLELREIAMATVTIMHRYGPQGIDGAHVDGVIAECSRCGHRVFGAGEGDSALKLCSDLLMGECPRGERNFYTTEILRVSEKNFFVT